MDILYLHQFFVTREGAGGTRSYEFARRFVERGHRVRMVTAGDTGATQEDGIDVVGVRGAYSDYMRATGDRRYGWVVANTFRQAMDARWGQFTNQWLDDTGWWALAWIRAYDLTHRARYLRMARYDTDYMWKYHDNVCGGGVW